MADITPDARTSAVSRPASGHVSPRPIHALDQLAAQALSAAVALLDAPLVSADQLELALRRAIYLKRAAMRRTTHNSMTGSAA